MLQMQGYTEVILEGEEGNYVDNADDIDKDEVTQNLKNSEN